MQVFDTIYLWNRNCLLDLRVQKLRIGLAWSHVELYRLVKDCQHEKIRIKSKAYCNQQYAIVECMLSEMIKWIFLLLKCSLGIPRMQFLVLT